MTPLSRCIDFRPAALALALMATAMLACAPPVLAAKLFAGPKPPAGGLRSPWDITPVVATDAPFDCGPAAPIGPDITVSGDLDADQRHVSEDVKAAVYGESTGALLDTTARVVHAADTYRATASRAAAAFVTFLLSSLADAHAMTGYMASDVAFAERSHAYRAFAIAWLKVRASGTATPQQTDAILQWLLAIVRIERTHWEHARCTERTCIIKNHKGLGTAMTAAAIAIAANDESLFHWSVGEYHAAINTLDGRGMLHYDTKGRYAFKNNLRSAAALVQIAEFSEINNMPLYGYNDSAIRLLVHTVALGIVSPQPYKTATGDGQRASKTIEPWEIAWATVFNRRYPDAVVASLLQQVGTASVDMWGGEPWDPQGQSEGQ